MATETYTPNQARSRPMEVLSLGLPRTGTRSMADAFELMGLTHCAHGFDFMENMPYAQRWEQAVDAKYLNKGTPFTRSDWDELLGHCSATTDFPCAAFWRELCAAYPDSKVVLVQRDEDKWYSSFVDGVIETQFTPSGKFVRDYVEPLLGSSVGRLSMKIMRGWLEAEGPEGMKANARSAYRKHYKEIKACISKDRLLEYRLGSGWEPLCEFLGRPKPDAAFPWVNEADALKVKIEEFKNAKAAELQVVVVRKVLPVVACLLIAVVAWRWS